jgi:hypothetical protein
MNLNRLWCFIVGHKQLRVFDKADLVDSGLDVRDGVAVGVEYRFRVTEQHKECSRCEKKLK